MIIRGENTIVIEQILIGDVWLCAGQSNMEWVVANSLHGEETIRNANDPEIHLLYIPPSIEFRPQKDIKSAVWQAAIGENIKHFSAVGYFFGKHIHESQGVPVGLISATRGKGGMTEPFSRRIFLSPARWSLTPDDLELAGSWKFRTSLRLKNPVATPVPEKTNPNYFPSCLYNGTLHPIIPFAIKGASRRDLALHAGVTNGRPRPACNRHGGHHRCRKST